jgi:hypothetical protein
MCLCIIFVSRYKGKKKLNYLDIISDALFHLPCPQRTGCSHIADFTLNYVSESSCLMVSSHKGKHAGLVLQTGKLLGIRRGDG